MNSPDRNINHNLYQRVQKHFQPVHNVIFPMWTCNSTMLHFSCEYQRDDRTGWVNTNIFKSISNHYDLNFLHNMRLQTYNNIFVQQAAITTVGNKSLLHL